MCSYALLVHIWLCYFVMKYIYKFHLSNDADFISLILSSRGKCTWKLNKGLSSAPTNAAKSPSSLPVLRSPSLGTTFVAPFSPTVVGSIPSRCKSSVLSLLKNAGSSATLGSQMRHRFCTLAGDQSVTNSGDDDDSKFQRGDVQALRKRIVEETSHTTAKVLDFQTRYKNYLRPQLVSRCLISPCPINDRWMVFLHCQTFKICGHNPSYLSCFDIMCYEHGCKDGEWELFLNHLLDKKVYVIEDWDSSYSTIETLMRM
ncbi:uncharacterized protein [Aegilops tauschii subsp. strangulata]|uniref:uncharacterized protein n=1 Tax=Aegilops tauschii subsp. strangulata TaxID=200361 RepID=UPI003CC86705